MRVPLTPELAASMSNDSPVVSEKCARQVLSQLLRLGFFHDDKRGQDEDDDDDGMEAFQKWKAARSNDKGRTWDGHCRIIPTISQDLYYTRGGLIKEILQRLQQEYHGRAALSRLCGDLDVDCETVFLSTQNDRHGTTIWGYIPKTVTVMKSGGGIELILDTYWKRIRQEVETQVTNQGSVNLVELSSSTQYNLPLEVFVEQVVSSLPPSVTYVEDSKTLASKGHLENLQHVVLQHFQSLQEPTQISAVCQQHGWDSEQVLEWLQKFQREEVHVDEASHQTAMHVPLVYSERQEHEVVDFLTTNGYITLDHVPNRHMLKTLVANTCPDALIIGDFEVVILDRILEEVKAAVQDYLASSSSQHSSSSEVLDLQEYLPSELVQPHIVPTILARIDFHEDQGVAAVAKDRAILVGKDLIRQMEERQISPLIEDFGKERAQELFNIANSREGEEGDDDGDEDPKTHRKGGKSKSKRGRAKPKRSVHDSDKVGGGLVPLISVTNGIANTYPSLGGDATIPESIGWEDDDVDGDSHHSSLLVAFCRRAFYTKKFQQKCDRAVNAELKRLQSEKDSKANLSRKDAAAKVRSVEAAFEEAFVTLCYLIQAQAKLFTFASSLESFDERSIEVLKQELLNGPCADLTSRITQQCLFQEEQDCLFSFRPRDDNESDKGIEKVSVDQIGLPEHCSQVNIAARSHPRIFLSCPLPREPLPVLRESFSGTTGVSLSRQWILCGGDCYQGGTRMMDNDDSDSNGDEVFHVRPGNLEGFMTHLEENCLALCGLPFKRLDKKNEKSFLFSRKQQLLGVLSLATDPLDVLDYTIMILFQQVRQLVVSGSLLRGPILTALAQERKIAAPVARALKLLNDAVESNGNPATDEKLLDLIKECGACRDISKHDTAPLEEHLSQY
jgi:hypothetical protein